MKLQALRELIRYIIKMKAAAQLILIYLCFCLTACTNVPYGDNNAAGRYYHIRGFNMYAETYGTGAPLLMIHGNGGSISTFKGSIPYFAQKYKVIIADSRAQGRSIDQKDSISFEMMADDYAALLDSMHVDSAYVVGWSDGGINALLLAMRHPGKVKKLVSSGANLWPDSTAIVRKEWENEKQEYPKYVNQVNATPEQKAKRKLFLLDLLQPHIPLDSLHKINCPALIMCGDDDVIRPEHTKAIFTNIRRANLWIVKHSGHGTLFAHRMMFNHNIGDFLEQPYHANRVFGSFWSKFF
jgi:pimeloyl-ACP methyl ester carboxylesterase